MGVHRAGPSAAPRARRAGALLPQDPARTPEEALLHWPTRAPLWTRWVGPRPPRAQTPPQARRRLSRCRPLVAAALVADPPARRMEFSRERAEAAATRAAATYAATRIAELLLELDL